MSKTIKCLSCGGSNIIENNQLSIECKYCGNSINIDKPVDSLNHLIIKENQRIIKPKNSNESIIVNLNNKGLIDYPIFEGLESLLSESLEWQKWGHRPIFSRISNKPISFESSEIMHVTSPFAHYGESNYRGLVILIYLEDINIDKFNKFELKNLFEDEDYCYSCVIEKDFRGAAYIVTRILIDLYNIDMNSKLYYENEDMDQGPESVRLYHGKVIIDNKQYIKEYNKKFSNNNNCFIATATMGSYDHPQVMELRHFRDEWILQKKWGENFVKWYYHYGSITAKFVEKSYVLKKLSYLLIVKPLVYLSRIVKSK